MSFSSPSLNCKIYTHCSVSLCVIWCQFYSQPFKRIPHQHQRKACHILHMLQIPNLKQRTIAKLTKSYYIAFPFNIQFERNKSLVDSMCDMWVAFGLCASLFYENVDVKRITSENILNFQLCFTYISICRFSFLNILSRTVRSRKNLCPIVRAIFTIQQRTRIISNILDMFSCTSIDKNKRRKWGDVFKCWSSLYALTT